MHASSNKGSDWWKSLAPQRQYQRIIMYSCKMSRKILLLELERAKDRSGYKGGTVEVQEF